MLPADHKTLTMARRTKKNLEYIYKRKKCGDDVEEFTQLINSMLGVVICIREDYFTEGTNKDYSWEKVMKLNLGSWNDTLPKISGKEKSDKKPKLKVVDSFGKLVTKLRHAFAHNNYEFFSKNEDGEIYGVTVWNLPIGKKEIEDRTWEADIDEKQLHSLINLIIDFLEETRGNELSKNVGLVPKSINRY